MRLYTYLTRRFLIVFFATMGSFWVLGFLLEVVEQIRRLSGNNASFTDILLLTLFNIPHSFYQILPLLFLIASVIFHSVMARNNEFVSIRSYGKSAWHIITPSILAGIILGMLSVAILNPIVATTGKIYETKIAEFTGKPTTIASITQNGLWLRQGSKDNNYVIWAQRSNFNGTTLFDVTFFNFTKAGEPIERLNAQTAQLGGGFWTLSNGKKWHLKDDTIPERNAQNFTTMRIASDLTAAYIEDSFGTPASISIWSLPQFIQRLDQAGFSALRHRVWFHKELAFPAFLAATILLGASLTMRHGRSQNTTIVIVTTFLMGFALYFTQNFALILAQNGQISYYVSAWFPTLAAIALSATIILHTEDG